MTGRSDWVPLAHVSVGGIKVAAASRAELTSAMVADCLAARSDRHRCSPRLIFDSNGHAISLAARDAAFRNALSCADVIHADGGFLIPASRRLAAQPIAGRSATTDLIHDFARAAEVENLSFYLLGGTEEVNARCAERLADLYPRLRIVGRHHGYFTPEEEEGVLADIGRSAADIVWIGLGKPREQLFAVAHRNRLGAAWAVTCGGCYNYITGHYGRAPGWMQTLNLEWLYRAITDPRKLFLRYLTTTPHALWLTLARIDRNIYYSAGQASE